MKTITSKQTIRLWADTEHAHVWGEQAEREAQKRRDIAIAKARAQAGGNGPLAVEARRALAAVGLKP